MCERAFIGGTAASTHHPAGGNNKVVRGLELAKRFPPMRTGIKTGWVQLVGCLDADKKGEQHQTLATSMAPTGLGKLWEHARASASAGFPVSSKRLQNEA